MRLVKHIPDAITSMNLLSGVAGVIFTMAGRPDLGFACMLAAAVFDFFDGLAARMLRACSAIGKELDSLCDVVSFGVLPSLMLFRLPRIDFGAASFPVIVLAGVPLLLGVFSALRLARFNIDERQHDAFLGLPTPAAAMICGALACFAYKTPDSLLAAWSAGRVFIPVLSLCLCALLVCEIPMFGMKFGGGKQADFKTNAERIAFLTIAAISGVVTAVLGLHVSMAVLLAFSAYILINLVFFLVPAGRQRG